MRFKRQDSRDIRNNSARIRNESSSTPFKKDFPFPLTATVLMSIHVSRELFGSFEGTVFHDSIESLLIS